MTMNIPNLLKLKAWLEAGAPHVILNMEYSQLTGDDWDDQIVPSYFITESGQAGKGDCGTVCCIAGAAELMRREEATGTPMHLLEALGDWDDVRDCALDWLGLESVDPSPYAMGHPLFDPDLAPITCTPAQAAEAVQRVIDGRDPWPDA